MIQMCEDSKWFALTSSLLSLHGTIPPSGTKKSRPAEHNVAKQTFVGESVAVIVSLLFTPLDSYICELWGKMTLYIAHDSQHIHSSGEPCPSLVRYCHLAGTGNEFSNGHSTLLSVQLLDIREFDETDEFHEHGPLLFLFCYDVHSLIRSSAV